MLHRLFKRKKSLSGPRMRAGFTLVEIMVVAAITVLIATIILVAMGESRNQAKDAAIKTSLAEIRKAAELLGEERETYEFPPDGVCDPADDTLSESGDFGQVEDYIEKQGGVVTCNDDSRAYAVISTLNRGDCWCVDSLGSAREITLSGAETCQSKLGAATVCP